MSHSGSSRSSGPAISHVTIPVIGRPVMTMDFAIIHSPVGPHVYVMTGRGSDGMYVVYVILSGAPAPGGH
jgi:hypothetical protein